MAELFKMNGKVKEPVPNGPEVTAPATPVLLRPATSVVAALTVTPPEKVLSPCKTVLPVVAPETVTDPVPLMVLTEVRVAPAAALNAKVPLLATGLGATVVPVVVPLPICKVPAERVVFPVYVLAPVKVQVPASCLVSALTDVLRVLVMEPPLGPPKLRL